MIQTETTPNPNSIKFISERVISNSGTEEFNSKNLNNVKNLFVKKLLSFKGVELVLLSKNFLTVKKADHVSWDSLKPTVISHMNDYFNKNKSPILDKSINDTKKNDGEENEIVSKIHEVLDTKIRPAVARDGGDIKFKSYENGVVKVELQGSCSGCPSSLMTLKQGVQNLLKHYIKEVQSVEAIWYGKKFIL